MGFLLCALFWGVVLVEEIERIPVEEWQSDGFTKVLLLRRTRTRFAFLFAMLVGVFFLWFEFHLVFSGRSTFNPLQAIGMGALLLGCYAFAVSKKGPRG